MSHCLVSFRGFEAPAWVLAGIRSGDIPGVCLFNFNFRDLRQLRELTDQLRSAAREGGQPPPLIGIDQEGGQLMAVTGGATELPGNMALGATRSLELAAAAGRIIASELSAVGCNLNFAPVLDLASQPASNAIGLRAFSDEPELTAALGAALIAAMQRGGVLACGKHFPGHGNTAIDSHHACPAVDRSLAELLELELAPYAAAFGAGLATIMTAHVRYPQLDDQPATFSEPILRGLLRERLGFTGLVITDALDMHALAAVGPQQRARVALEAGADLALLGHVPDQERQVEELESLRLPESAARITRVRAQLPTTLPELDTTGWAEHRRSAKAMAEAAITVVKGAARLPLRLDPASRLSLISVTAGNLTPAETYDGFTSRLGEQIAARHPTTETVAFAFESPAAEIDRVVNACEGAGAVIFASVNAVTDPGQQTLLERLLARGHQPIVLALRSAADAQSLRRAAAIVCSYGRREMQTEAATAVLFGELTAQGRLPVRLEVD